MSETTSSAVPAPSHALYRAARAMKFSLVINGVVWWGTIVAGVLLALILLDNALHLPQAIRLPVTVLFAGFAIYTFISKIGKPLIHPISPERAARSLEVSRGIRGNTLINAFFFEKSNEKDEVRKYVAPTLKISATLLKEIKPRTIWVTRKLRNWFLILTSLVILWMGIAVLFPKNISTSAIRIFMPLADIPLEGKWSLSMTPTSPQTLIEGDNLEILVTVKSHRVAKESLPTPVIVWKDGENSMESTSGANKASMLPAGEGGKFKFAFSSVNRLFSFRVWADDSCTKAVAVKVQSLPRIKEATFSVEPPEYMAIKPYTQPGPPATLNVPAGSAVTASFNLSAESTDIKWREKKETIPLKMKDKKWQLSRIAKDSIAYEILAKPGTSPVERTISQGQISVIADRSPDIDFVTDDRNLIVNPGATLPLVIKAGDDNGVSSITLKIARQDDPSTTQIVKSWSYMGPPGQKSPEPEKYKLSLKPDQFIPGTVYILTAEAKDFNPSGATGTSRPVLIRISGLQDLSVPKGDPLEKFFSLLKAAIAKQTTANGLTDNLILHLTEALAAKDIPKHKGVIGDSQKQAREAGNTAYDEAVKRPEAQSFIFRLQTLIRGEMGLALEQISKLDGNQAEELKNKHLLPLQKRQDYILNELISLLGQVANDRQEAAKQKALKKGEGEPPAVTAEKMMGELKDDLKNFIDDQKKIIAASKSLKDLNPEDLTDKQEALLGELAREEAQKAAYFQEKLTDFSKLPLQDFADGKVVKELNEVFQEVQAATGALYEKKIELAVPREESGLELAEELEQNLERWLPDTKDLIKWSMEEDTKQADAPMAELPKELEDIVGELLDKEEEMADDVEDVTSTFMDSLDKGAGWTAGDGPISNMSARGITGNQLPNKNEVGGRSGEGRSGKSSGQMVEDTATGKGGRETPTRLSSTPFEQGRVDDQSKDNKGGATGGGKQAGFGQEGLHGALPPPTEQKMKRLAEQQSKLRQQAESMVLQLRKQRKPTGDLESAINSMKKMEDAAKKQNGIDIAQGYHQAMDALASARNTYRGNRVSRLEINSLNSQRKDLNDAQAESIPGGYEEMTSAYFRALSEANNPKP